MNFVKKIFDGKSDYSVHLQFQKFSKGTFSKRALIAAKKTKDVYKISTGPEFANELVAEVARALGDKKAKVTGVIVSTLDVSKEPKFREILGNCDVKQFMGIKQFKVDHSISGKDILGLLDSFPKAFFALTFGAGNSELRIKPKAPKSAKPSTKEEDSVKADFCKLVTSNPSIGKDFVFERPEFKTAEISHDFVVEGIVFPPGEKDFAKIREMAKRQGKILRKAVIDGKEIKSEIKFSA